MSTNFKAKYYIVNENILPEAILKTAQTKELLAKTPHLTVNDAVDRIGLSRSAFYKYRDGVFPFYEATREKIITLQITLDHQAGVLSNCINSIALAKGNILTINQGLPFQGMARATIAFETAGMIDNMEVLLEKLYEIPGILQVEIVGQN